jgi:hypothetical protein
MTTPYENFLPEVVPYVRDVAEPVAVASIRNACMEFCDRTLWWQYEVATVPGVSGQADYTLALPTGTGLSMIMEAYYDGARLNPMTIDDLTDGMWSDWRITTANRPTAITQLSTTSIRLAPKPSEALTNGLSLIVALRPTRDSTAVLDDIYERFAEAISYGARARLYEQPNAPYSNPSEGLSFHQRFRHECGKATILRNRSQNRVSSVMRPPRFI